MQDTPDKRVVPQGLPSVEVDPVVLNRPKQRLLAKMFGVESEPPRFGHYEILGDFKPITSR